MPAKNKVQPAESREAVMRDYFAQIGRKGAKTRAKRYSHAQLSAWAKRGGRPSKQAKAKKGDGNERGQ